MSEDYLRHMASMDAGTLEQLMKQYGQDVWNFAYLITKNRSMSDDIAQDVFLQAFRHISTYRGEASVKTWLLKITRNISYNQLNTAFFRRVLLIDFVTSSAYDRSAEQAYLDQEAASEVWRQVFSLPAKHREVIVLHAKYQLPLSEIALILKIPEGTVKSRLFGARKKLSLRLKEEGVHEFI